MAEHFADRLMAAIEAKNSRVCVGIDPVPERIPGHLQRSNTHGETDRIAGVREFCMRIVRAVADHCVAVKPNSAFFEALGAGGPELLHDVVCEARHLGLIVIVDAKRADIGSTAEAYARALFTARETAAGDRPDAVTVNPYLGSDGVLPFVRTADETGGGVFVLVKTSNPSAAEIQDLDAGGRPVYRHVAELVRTWGEGRVGRSGYSSVGAVVGATWPAQLAELRAAMPHTPFLVPGYGAQGGGAADVVAAFDDQGLGAIINSSRGVIYAYAADDRFSADEFDRAAAAAAETMRREINKVLDA